MRKTTTACLLALTLTAASALGGPAGYVTNFSGAFGVIDLTSGVFTPIGPGMTNSPDGLGGAPGGPFYTVDSVTGHTLRITPGGVVTDIGDTGTGSNNGPNGVSVIGSLTSGALYALDFSNRLFSIDSGNGTLALLGTLPLPQQEDAYVGNMTTSFNGNATHLFYSLEISEGPNTTGPTLFEIDPLTLQMTSLGLTNLTSRIIGSGFIGDTLYAFTEFGDIVTINTATGVAAGVGHYESGSSADAPGPPFTGIFGVVATPEPSAAWLSAGGLIVMAWRRFRRR
ncbi:MAG: hypothetical protein EXQ52_16650 [Bryobacterales bacterium]|nr:hypothetical protein [Bryobacterales bacterium]